MCTYACVALDVELSNYWNANAGMMVQFNGIVKHTHTQTDTDKKKNQGSRLEECKHNITHKPLFD